MENTWEIVVHFDGNDNILGMSKQLTQKVEESSVLEQTVTTMVANGYKNKSGFYKITLKQEFSNSMRMKVEITPLETTEQLRVYLPQDIWFDAIEGRINEVTEFVFSEDYNGLAVMDMLKEQTNTKHVSFPLGRYTNEFIQILYDRNVAHSNGGVRFSFIQEMMKKTPSILLDSFLLDNNEQRMRTIPNVLNRHNGTHYFLPDNIRKILNYITAPLAGLFSISKVGLFGRAGAGKTALGKALSEHYGLDYVYVNMAQIQTPIDLFYRRTIKQGEMLDELSPLTNELLKKTTKGVVIALDEINRVQTELTNPLLALLGEQHVLTMGDGSTVEFEGNRPIIFVITGNVGGQYVGTDVIDPALLSRISAIVEMEGIDKEMVTKIMKGERISASISDETISKIAEIIVKTSDQVDNNGGMEITTRHAVDVMKLLVSDIPLDDAVKIVIVNKQDASIRSSLEETINALL